MNIRAWWRWSILLVLLLDGCAGMGAQKRMNTLHDATNGYRILMRWGQYEEATKYIRFQPGQEGPKTLNLEPLNSIRLASYDIVDQIVSNDETEATLNVVMTYYHEESNVLHTLRDVQHWWYNEEQKRWYLDSKFPDFIGNLQKNR